MRDNLNANFAMVGDRWLKTVCGNHILFRVVEVSGKSRKLRDVPGFVRVAALNDDTHRLSFCGTQWKKWTADALWQGNKRGVA